MTERPDLQALFLEDTPLLDVRAEVEFAKGAFPHTTNLPILTDPEREQVGTTYKQEGQEAAIRLGHRLVNPEVRAQRLAHWQAWVAANPTGRLYCFRGGMRSALVEEWLAQAGTPCEHIPGGYKAMRQYLIEEIERSSALPLVVLSGRTGTGKTHLLNELPDSVDLEGHGHHRGSAFGRFLEQQPTQINFENTLAIDLLKRRVRDGVPRLVLEDESRILGSLHIPLALHQAMKESPIVVLECSYEERIATVLEDYFISRHREAVEALGETSGSQAFREYLMNGLNRIRKRLGGERHSALSAVLSDALDRFLGHAETQGFVPFIESLLKDYYDPMYDYQLSLKADKVAFRGDREAIRDWFRQ